MGTGVAAAALTAVVTGDSLFAPFGSLVLLPAVIVGVTLPAAGAVYVAVQVMLLPAASGVAVGTGGVHVTVAPGGSPLMAHVAAAAGFGPLFAQVNVPFTVEPAIADGGKLADTVMSAESKMSSCTCVGAPSGRYESV